jgi:hypothetical protein
MDRQTEQKGYFIKVAIRIWHQISSNLQATIDRENRQENRTENAAQ